MLRLPKFLALSCLVLVLSATVLVRTQQAPVPSAPDTPPMPDVLQQYSTVTLDRLKRPADGDWLMIRRTYDGWGFSPLRQITTDNVSHLEPVWSFATGA